LYLSEPAPARNYRSGRAKFAAQSRRSGTEWFSDNRRFGEHILEHIMDFFDRLRMVNLNRFFERLVSAQSSFFTSSHSLFYSIFLREFTKCISHPRPTEESSRQYTGVRQATILRPVRVCALQIKCRGIIWRSCSQGIATIPAEKPETSILASCCQGQVVFSEENLHLPLDSIPRAKG